VSEAFVSSYFQVHVIAGQKFLCIQNREYDAVKSGFSTFENCEPCVLGFGHFIRLPATSVKSELWNEVPFHVNLHIFVSTSLGENVSAGRNAQRNLFSETLFIQDLSLDGAALVLGSFLLCFCGVFSACRNVLPSTFRGAENREGS